MTTLRRRAPRAEGRPGAPLLHATRTPGGRRPPVSSSRRQISTGSPVPAAVACSTSRETRSFFVSPLVEPISRSRLDGHAQALIPKARSSAWNSASVEARTRRSIHHGDTESTELLRYPRRCVAHVGPLRDTERSPCPPCSVFYGRLRRASRISRRRTMSFGFGDLFGADFWRS